MEMFFSRPESLDTKLWKGLMVAFVGLGVLAAIVVSR